MDRDYAELSQLVPVPGESQRRRTANRSVIDGEPASKAADGLVLGNSALNARYMSGQQQVSFEIYLLTEYLIYELEVLIIGLMLVFTKPVCIWTISNFHDVINYYCRHWRQTERQTDRQTAVFLDVFVERLSFIFSRCRYYKKRQ